MMISTCAFRVVSAAFCLCGLVFTPACSDIATKLAGDWADNSPDKNMVSAAKKGMRANDIIVKIGKPQKVIEGDLVYAGWQEWVYPTGSLFLQRGEVRMIQARPLTKEQLTKLKKEGILPDAVKNLSPLEGDAKENQKSELELAEENEEDKWKLDGFKPYTPYRSADKNPNVVGISK